MNKTNTSLFRRFRQLPAWNRIELCLTLLTVPSILAIAFSYTAVTTNLRLTGLTQQAFEAVEGDWRLWQGLAAALVLVQLVLLFLLTRFNYYRIGGDLSPRTESAAAGARGSAPLRWRDSSPMENARVNEVCMLFVRWCCFLGAAVLAVGCRLLGWRVAPIIGLSYAVLLIPCFYQSASRLTFRVWPSALLAAAGAVLFLCLIGNGFVLLPQWDPAGELALETWETGGGVKLAQIIKDLPDTFTSSVILVTFAPMFLYLARQIYDLYRSQVTSDAGKATRRQLLTHWWFNPETPLLDNAALLLLVGYALGCFAAIIVSLPLNYDPEDPLPFFEYLAFLGSAVAFIGAVTLFEIRDSSLLQSEYSYLLYLSLHLNNVELVPGTGGLPSRILGHLSRGMLGCVGEAKADRRLNDYCQVFSNLFTHFSAFASENEELHKLKRLMQELGRSERLSSVTKSMLISRSIRAFEDALAPGGGEKKPEGAEGPTAPELLFAACVQTLFRESAQCTAADRQPNCAGRICVSIREIEAAQQMMRRALKRTRMEWRLVKYGVSIEDFTNLVQYDALIEIAHWQERSSCMFQWLCRPEQCRFCRRKNNLSPDFSEDSERQNQRLLFLLYPAFLLVSIVRRWPNLLVPAEEKPEDAGKAPPQEPAEEDGYWLTDEALERLSSTVDEAFVADIYTGAELAKDFLSAYYYAYLQNPPTSVRSLVFDYPTKVRAALEDLAKCLGWYVHGTEPACKKILTDIITSIKKDGLNSFFQKPICLSGEQDRIPAFYYQDDPYRLLAAVIGKVFQPEKNDGESDAQRRETL